MTSEKKVYIFGDVIIYYGVIIMSNNENYIREAAYFLWQNAGCPSGQDEKFWSMAVEQLSSCSKKSCSAKKPSCASKKPAAKKPAAKSSKK